MTDAALQSKQNIAIVTASYIHHIFVCIYETYIGISQELIGIRHLDIAWCRKITDIGVHYLMQTCHLMESLNVSNCDLISNECLEDLQIHRPALQIINERKQENLLKASDTRFLDDESNDINNRPISNQSNRPNTNDSNRPSSRHLSQPNTRDSMDTPSSRHSTRPNTRDGTPGKRQSGLPPLNK